MQFESMDAILTRCTAWLKEKPRNNWISLVSKSGVQAILFYSQSSSREGEGVVLQFVGNYAYILNSTEQSKWCETGHGDLGTLSRAFEPVGASVK